MKPEKPHIGDVLICRGMPKDGNPYGKSIMGNERKANLLAFKNGEPTEGYTFWHGPANSGSRQIFSPDEVDWYGSGL